MLPNVIIIGAQKCGTTSLHYYLDQHPDISMTKEKELDFFVTEKNWNKGFDWYRHHFAGMKTRIRGESSPAYTHFPVHKDVPERIAKHIPDVKLIYMVRDPVARVISNWIHLYAAELTDKPLVEMLRDPKNILITRSRYYWQLEFFLQYFNRSQILVITQESLNYDRANTLHCVFEFLGVDANFTSPAFAKTKHESSTKRRKTRLGSAIWKSMPFLAKLPTRYRSFINIYGFYLLSTPIPRPVLPDDIRQDLIEYFREDVSKLRAFTGLSLADWCV